MYGIMLDESHSKLPAKHTFIPYSTKVHHQKIKKPSYGTMLDASYPNIYQNTFYDNLLYQGCQKRQSNSRSNLHLTSSTHYVQDEWKYIIKTNREKLQK